MAWFRRIARHRVIEFEHLIMRLLQILLSCFILIPSLGWTDQTDPRLDELFVTLKQTADGQVIRSTENRIWSIWLQHTNSTVVKLMQMGSARMNGRLYSDALLIYSSIIENFPDYAEAWNQRATLYYIVGNHDASIADIEKVLTLEPRHFGALSGLGLVYIQREELNKAKHAFEDLIAVHPNSPNAQQNLQSVIDSLRRNVI
ncbi:MAG TPA: tetratricopeptide repeat protein [Gammaproteobacteria bacterium]|jgi:tetratricopeptide (TPR) repeat protein|nr:tetratricopeptide repeat protein [Gammaproteobacteria bacterium]HIL62887.1 tetratricopeptide repeat protein [Porticoccaceae bacterium]|tara:strand:+ start:18160 stop:18765 length:606 start_codon:yes stop_codon:yes gene_type:complete